MKQACQGMDQGDWARQEGVGQCKGIKVIGGSSWETHIMSNPLQLYSEVAPLQL